MVDTIVTWTLTKDLKYLIELAVNGLQHAKKHHGSTHLELRFIFLPSNICLYIK